MAFTWQKNPGEPTTSIDETVSARREQEQRDREERIAEQGAKLRAQTDALKERD